LEEQNNELKEKKTILEAQLRESYKALGNNEIEINLLKGKMTKNSEESNSEMILNEQNQEINMLKERLMELESSLNEKKKRRNKEIS